MRVVERVPERDRRVPSFRELRARLRTERAEARLLDTEIRLHCEAARIRRRVRAGQGRRKPT